MLPFALLRVTATTLVSAADISLDDDNDDWADVATATFDEYDSTPATASTFKPRTPLDTIVLWVLTHPQEFFLGCAAVLIPVFLLAGFAAILMIRQLDANAVEAARNQIEASEETEGAQPAVQPPAASNQPADSTSRATTEASDNSNNAAAAEGIRNRTKAKR